MGDALFVDISSWQPDQIDWAQYDAWSAQGDGFSRVLLRSSQGVGYTDSHFEHYWSSATSAGTRQIGIYHYAYPQYNSPEAEADWCWKVVNNRLRPGDFLMLDYEEDTVHATADWAYRWLVRIQQHSGSLPYCYSYLSFIQRRLQDKRLASFPLVLAKWTFNPDVRPPAPAPWSTITILQYSDSGSVPGIGGRVDMDVYLGVPVMPLPEGPFIDVTVGAPGGPPKGTSLKKIGDQFGYDEHTLKAIQYEHWADNYTWDDPGNIDGQVVKIPGFPPAATPAPNVQDIAAQVATIEGALTKIKTDLA